MQHHASVFAGRRAEVSALQGVPMRSAIENLLFDFLTDIKTLDEPAAIMERLAKVAGFFGLDSFAISGIPLPHERIEPYLLLNAWPEEWANRYMTENYVHSDPVIYRCKGTDRGFVWSEAVGDAPIGQKARRVMNEATEFRMIDGFSVPIHSPGGIQAIVTFSGEKVDMSEEERAVLELIAIYAHKQLRDLIPREKPDPRQATAQITARELEVIHWAAEGKSNWEIGQILARSEKTVQHILASAQYKLDVTNRTQLVAEAFRTGLIR